MSVVVLKTHGQGSSRIAHTFWKQLGNDRFGVLHNGVLYSKAPYRFCTWTFYDFTQQYSRLVESSRFLPKTKRHTPGNEEWLSPHFAIMAPLMLFYTGKLTGTCNALRNGMTHVWAVESDAMFHGNSESFFRSFDATHADLLSTGFAVADRGWWGYPLHTSNFPAPQHFDNLPKFSCVQDALARECTPQKCSFHASARSCPRGASGYLFRLVVVERFSTRLLTTIDEHLQESRAITGEAFASSVCAWADDCSYLDWQDLQNGRFRSDNFVWHPRPVERSRMPHMTKDIWYHPIKPFHHSHATRLKTARRMNGWWNALSETQPHRNHEPFAQLFRGTIADSDVTCRENGLVLTVVSADVPAKATSAIRANRAWYTQATKLSNGVFRMADDERLRDALSKLSHSWSHTSLSSFKRWIKLIVIGYVFEVRTCLNSWVFWLDADALFMEAVRPSPPTTGVVLTAHGTAICDAHTPPGPTQAVTNVNSGAMIVQNGVVGKLFIYTTFHGFLGQQARAKIASGAAFDVQENVAVSDWAVRYRAWTSRVTSTTFNAEAYNWRPGYPVIHFAGGDDLVDKYNTMVKVHLACRHSRTDMACGDTIHTFAKRHNEVIMKAIFNQDRFAVSCPA